MYRVEDDRIRILRVVHGRRLLKNVPGSFEEAAAGNLQRSMSSRTAHHWSADVFREMQARDIATVCTVPDGGLTQLLNLIEAEPRCASSR